jgi:hypothetical protein
LVRRGALAALLGALAVAGCGEHGVERVDPADHDAFFLWAGVRPPRLLDRAKTIYLLAGEVRAGDNARLVPLRPGTPHLPKTTVWMTVRVERLDWQEAVYSQVLSDLARWERAGNRLAGLQIDFDARTRGLGAYAGFLADLRRRLPARQGLSVTGLMDWSAHGDPAVLARLAGVVDEVVVQTYQGRRTIPGYARYMASLRRLSLPYRVALVEGGDWREPPGLAGDPRFKGYVVFLVPHGQGAQPTASRN